MFSNILIIVIFSLILINLRLCGATDNVSAYGEEQWISDSKIPTADAK